MTQAPWCDLVEDVEVPSDFAYIPETESHEDETEKPETHEASGEAHRRRRQWIA